MRASLGLRRHPRGGSCPSGELNRSTSHIHSPRCKTVKTIKRQQNRTPPSCVLSFLPCHAYSFAAASSCLDSEGLERRPPFERLGVQSPAVDSLSARRAATGGCFCACRRRTRSAKSLFWLSYSVLCGQTQAGSYITTTPISIVGRPFHHDIYLCAARSPTWRALEVEGHESPGRINASRNGGRRWPAPSSKSSQDDTFPELRGTRTSLRPPQLDSS